MLVTKNLFSLQLQLLQMHIKLHFIDYNEIVNLFACTNSCHYLLHVLVTLVPLTCLEYSSVLFFSHAFAFFI